MGWVEASWWQRKAEESYGIAEAELTEWRPWSLPSLRKAFNETKHANYFAGWWAENSKEAYSTGLANAAAFDNYAKSKRGGRKGKQVGMPRFKSRHRARLACRFTTGTTRVDADRRHVRLPRLGTLRTHESPRKLQRRITNGTARILGEIRYIPNPAHYDSALKTLKRLSRRVSSRQGPDRRTGQKPSRCWHRANAERNRIHPRVANLRADALHKLTTSIRAEYGTVVVEDLNVAGMLKNRRLARKIADAGFGEIRRQLTYKGRRNACRTVVANRWYPSSKTCSNCGVVKAKLPLHVRVFGCDECPLVMDRNENAARNLAALAADCMTGTAVAGDRGTRVPKPRGADQETRTTRQVLTGLAGRAGGANPTSGRKEARDLHQDTTPQPGLW